MKHLHQITGKIWMGRFKVTFARVGAYIGYVNFLMLLLTFYSVSGYKYASLNIFLLFAIIGIVTLGLIDYLIVMPCEIAFTNEQIAKHQNPIYNEIKEIKKMLDSGVNKKI